MLAGWWGSAPRSLLSAPCSQLRSPLPPPDPIPRSPGNKTLKGADCPATRSDHQRQKREGP
jgi:hypothetical protein